MRTALVVAHAARPDIARLTAAAARQLRDAGFTVRMLVPEAAECESGPGIVPVEADGAADGAEIVVVFGGDGTFLRAAELARPSGVPMLGVNLGRVGFLAEAEPDALVSAIQTVADARYTIEERITVDVTVHVDGEADQHAWALNEASVEKSTPPRMLEVGVSVDAGPLLRFGCDGILCATPTGSTAYAYSAGGPIVWPTVDAMLVVPNAAHALFARPIVVAPTSVIEIELMRLDYGGILSCDGRRSIPLPGGCRLTVHRGALPIRIARLADWNFGERLVTKFQLPVRGFRDNEGV